MTIGIIGAGNLGTALAVLAAKNGHDVRMWDIDRTVLDDIRARHENTVRLPGVALAPTVVPVGSTQDVLDSEVVFVAVPSFAVRAAAAAFTVVRPGTVIVTAAKGWDIETRKLPHETLSDVLPDVCKPFVCALGGSAVASQFARGVPTTFVLGTWQLAEAGRKVSAAISSATACVSVSDDPRGVALGGALKNIYAIGIGILDGVSLSSNTKAMLVAAASGEMAALGEALGGRRETLLGLAGLGDLVGTGFAVESRNRVYGELLGRNGFRADEPARAAAEGVRAASVARELARGRGLSLPILEAMDDIISGRAEPRSLFENLARLCVRS